MTWFLPLVLLLKEEIETVGSFVFASAIIKVTAWPCSEVLGWTGEPDAFWPPEPYAVLAKGYLEASGHREGAGSPVSPECWAQGGVGKLRGLSLTFQGVSLASMSLTPALIRVGELGSGLSQPYSQAESSLVIWSCPEHRQFPLKVCNILSPLPEMDLVGSI